MSDATTQTNDPFDVVQVGLGPVGATAAILFAEEGLRVAAVERDTEVYRLPRAVNLDGEIVRAMQRVGRGEAVFALMQTHRDGERAGFANSKREFMFGVEGRPIGPNGWQPMNMFDQPEFEAYLRAEALRHPNVTGFVGWEASDLRNVGSGDDAMVELTATPIAGADAGGRPVALSGRYLLGCDGAASPIRRALGIEWTSLGYDQDWLVVDIVVKEGNTLGLDTMQVCDPDRLSTYVATKDPYRRWEFRLNEGETAEQILEPETIASLIDEWTPRDTYDLRRAAVYQFHAATAGQWRVGNIFLAGDAAHQTPPFLGQGMNMGMRDVVNLAWKLRLVINGEADDALLDTYAAERDPHATDMVDWAVAIGRLMEHLAAVELAEREGRPPPDTAPNLQASGYGQGRGQPPFKAGVLVVEQVSDEGATGHLLPQPIVRSVDAAGAAGDAGGGVRFDEVLGTGWAVIGRTAADVVVGAEAAALLGRLGASFTCLDDWECVEGRFDRLFDEHGAAIVRPDRFIFGHTTEELSLDELVRRLPEALHLT